jgi:hypothetical protein
LFAACGVVRPKKFSTWLYHAYELFGPSAWHPKNTLALATKSFGNSPFLIVRPEKPILEILSYIPPVGFSTLP